MTDVIAMLAEGAKPLTNRGATVDVQALERILGFWRIARRRCPEDALVEVERRNLRGGGSGGIGREGDKPVGQALGEFEEGPRISAGMAADLPPKEK